MHYVILEIFLSVDLIIAITCRNKPACSFATTNYVILNFNVNTVGLELSATQVNSKLMVFELEGCIPLSWVVLQDQIASHCKICHFFHFDCIAIGVVDHIVKEVDILSTVDSHSPARRVRDRTSLDSRA